MNTISNTDNIIDSRDVIARIEELEESIDAYENPEGDLEAHDAHIAEKEELTSLKALAEEAEGYAPDWHHGATLIRDSYFEGYARELAEDLGAINKDASWPNTCIDWEQAASELQQDYTPVEFDGVTYWVR